MDDAVIESLTAAVQARPDDLPLRLHLATMLVDAGRGEDAVTHLAAVLARDPGSVEARALMARALDSGPRPGPGSRPTGGAEQSDVGDPDGVDWAALSEDLSDVVPPMFVDGSGQDAGDAAAHDVEHVGVRLSDVGGLQQVKDRLEVSFLAPMRNPELRSLYKTSLRGGLMLYGPPGCGKTFLAKAVAGELGAAFLHVSLADVLDMYIGQSERNIQELFNTARAAAPCVLFLDELDAIGAKRSLTRHSGTRTAVNQLLTELDGVGSDNDGLYLLAATNHPWDVDPALRRPGRLDRTLLVLPPDHEARVSILRTHLRGRPVERIDLAKLAKRTDGFSGADLMHLCDSATERALLDSSRSGQVRMITMSDFEHALGEVRPSIGPWLETARNVAVYGNATGEYDELAAYLRTRGRR